MWSDRRASDLLWRFQAAAAAVGLRPGGSCQVPPLPRLLIKQTSRVKERLRSFPTWGDVPQYLRGLSWGFPDLISWWWPQVRWRNTRLMLKILWTDATECLLLDIWGKNCSHGLVLTSFVRRFFSVTKGLIETHGFIKDLTKAVLWHQRWLAAGDWIC